MDIQSSVEKFIYDELMLGSGSEKLDPQESLIEKGVIDSLSLLRLIAFIEENFNVRVEDEEVHPESFKSIETIKEFIERKM